MHSNLLGSPVAGESNTISYTERYSPWGVKDASPSQLADDLGYTGHQSDQATGLTYMQARYYDPVIGRFMAADPVGYTIDSPMSFNRYLYVNNNPYKYIDPDGNAAQIVARCAANTGCRATTAGVVGFGAGYAVNALVQLKNNGTVNQLDAVAAGTGAAAVSAAVAAKPSLLTKKKELAAISAGATAAVLSAADAANGRKQDLGNLAVNSIASTLGVRGGIKFGDAVENLLGAKASSILGEVFGAGYGEATALGIGQIIESASDKPLFPNGGSTSLPPRNPPTASDFLRKRNDQAILTAVPRCISLRHVRFRIHIFGNG